MTKLSFPDINVWVALAVESHVHHPSARTWWDADYSEGISFCRFTQIGLLRLLTTASAMGGTPLTNHVAWRVYESFFEDHRVRVFPELPAIDEFFRRFSDVPQSSPKIWADCYLAAHAAANQAALITFDQGFSRYDVERLILT